MEPGIYDNLSNEEYHAEKTHLSSSNLKMLLKDPEQFYDQKILGNKPARKNSPNREEGSLTHTLILEPHMVEQEYAFWEGWRKQGKEYTAFKEANPGKVYISLPQKHKCDKYVQAYERNPLAVELISGGSAEQSLFGNIAGVPTKVRWDYLNEQPDEARGYIADIKTSAYPVDPDSFKQTVDHWGYDISAAMYLEMVEQHYGKPFDFYFIAIGKQDFECEVYRLSEETRQKGSMSLMKAIRLFKSCKESGNWEVKSKEPKTDYEILEV